ncbi:hypothetical protein QBC47DRAFT_457992 [Echria macrotheca]|uniref:RING-type domain-containing protein n=1 Tax=Echria macrotheca TaxID=438768 RepID=A0AAJ0BK56_9PEZI|nr:hypothetical protein QBC47DRAFT_457992 [Echria macrotheca]
MAMEAHEAALLALFRTGDNESLARRLGTRDPALFAAIHEEAQSMRDREIAVRLSVLYNLEDTVTKPRRRDRPEESSSSAHGLKDQICVCCSVDIPAAAVIADCGHKYCLSCVEIVVRNSVTDEALFPFRCCGQPLTDDRLLCRRKTCSLCKTAPHVGTDCPNDPAGQQLMRLARENKWQQCYCCKRMVELAFGCSHITCRCRAQFCYQCGAKWRSCKCEHWDEDRLLNGQNQAVRPEPARIGGPG